MVGANSSSAPQVEPASKGLVCVAAFGVTKWFCLEVPNEHNHLEVSEVPKAGEIARVVLQLLQSRGRMRPRGTDKLGIAGEAQQVSAGGSAGTEERDQTMVPGRRCQVILAFILSFCSLGALIVVCALYADRYGRGLREILNKDRDWLDEDTISARAGGSSPTEASNDRPTPTGHHLINGKAHGQSSPEHNSSAVSTCMPTTRAEFTFGHQLIAGGALRRVL